MDIHPVWKKVLEELDICNWYKTLLAEYQGTPAFADHSITEAQEMIKEFGYDKTVYDAKTAVYTVELVDEVRTVKGLGSGITISLKDGFVDVAMVFDLDHDVKEGGKLNKLCEVLGQPPVPEKPSFTNYKELYALLKKIFTKYDEISNKVIDLYLEEPASLSRL
ncbi:hypothetical protein EGT74_18195 [Chitinophaga lutea]|uniref:Uncharacterized protein n=1 Tax=Chitinophaga lutea TaxID=2488634 RepID=A0A3N4PMX5_9BACT|nr:hypothetical protein [Chitinophaga lutea]RPE08948.1 hypothetical protein EGT74_18195 [Chitinophaga lutea]